MHCAQLHTILHRRDLIIFPLTASRQSSLFRWCLFEERGKTMRGKWRARNGEHYGAFHAKFHLDPCIKSPLRRQKIGCILKIQHFVVAPPSRAEKKLNASTQRRTFLHKKSPKSFFKRFWWQCRYHNLTVPQRHQTCKTRKRANTRKHPTFSPSGSVRSPSPDIIFDRVTDEVRTIFHLPNFFGLDW